MNVRLLTIQTEAGALSAELLHPPGARTLLILAHGAGAGFRHASMVAISEALAARRVATLRFNFPFMEAKKRRVDARPVAVAAIAAAAAAGRERAPELDLYVGGHSFGGRMASHAVADGAVSPSGLICLSFPLHPANRPGVTRAEHLGGIRVPMLFLSGTRDALADAKLLEAVIAPLNGHARLHWLEDADHGYRARKRTRRDPRSVFDEIADEVGGFVAASGSGGTAFAEPPAPAAGNDSQAPGRE